MFAGGIGTVEILIILFFVLIIFGAGKLPKLGEGWEKESAALRKRLPGCMTRTRKQSM